MAVANIDTVYQQVLVIANKNQIGNYLDSIEFNRYAELVQREWFNEAYQDFEANQNASDNMAVLKVASTILPVSSSGRVTKPTDYMHLEAVSSVFYKSQTESKLVELEKIADAEYRAMTISPSLTPSKEFPVCLIKDTYIQVYPKNLSGVVEVDYLRQPVNPVWGFTVVSDEKVYNAGTSTDFEVPEQHTEDLVQRIVKMFGFEIRDEALVNYESQTGKPVQ